MGRDKVLITVKTYPTLSRKHGELVCTAGVREDGSRVRLYPIPFRLLKTDLHFFLGTTKEFHSWATNPFLIIGVFPIPHEKQLGLL
jgi:hypothetical protein